MVVGGEGGHVIVLSLGGEESQTKYCDTGLSDQVVRVEQHDTGTEAEADPLGGQTQKRQRVEGDRPSSRM